MTMQHARSVALLALALVVASGCVVRSSRPGGSWGLAGREMSDGEASNALASSSDSRALREAETSGTHARSTNSHATHDTRASKDTHMQREAHGFLFETLTLGEREYRYATFVPRDFVRNEQRAGVLFLHGMGESGTDGSLQLAVGLGPAILRAPEAWPFVVVFPQKPAREDEWEDHEGAVLAMLDRATERYGLDRSRIALTGLSQGGHGTWEIARRNPERFAALAPLCGYPAPPARGWHDFVRERDWTIDAARASADELAHVLSKTPIFAFHGDADDAVPIAFSDVVVDALRARGSNVRYERLPGVAHDCWTHAYQRSELATWLHEQLSAPSPR